MKLRDVNYPEWSTPELHRALRTALSSMDAGLDGNPWMSRTELRILLVDARHMLHELQGRGEALRLI